MLSPNKEVQQLINNLEAVDTFKYQIFQNVRRILFEMYPRIQERVMYGGIIFSLKDDFGGVFAYKNHVSFEFSYGYKLKDSKGLLEGSGKFRRHLKIKSMDDKALGKLPDFLRQIAELDD